MTQGSRVGSERAGGAGIEGSEDGRAAGVEGGARAGLLDLLHLGAKLVAARIRSGTRGDPGAAGCRWARELLGREGSSSLDVPLPGRSVRLVGERELSERVLSAAPDAGGPPPGRLKEEAMGFLAPGALTVAHGEEWARLRRFNERVLGEDGLHPFADRFHRAVREAFAEPVRDLEGVRERMARVMVDVVLGEVGPDADPATDVRVLFDVVQSPLRRKLLGFLYARRRRRLFGLLERVLEASDDGRRTLLARAREEAGDLTREEVLQQVPHWMFTFTGSGTALMGRALALITARPRVLRRVRDELGDAGPPDDPATVLRLHYLEACLREAGRLFPPVTKTFHRSRRADGDVDLAHYFPLLQRNPDLGPSVDGFRPERWTGPEADPSARASNLFLRGPRSCPGENLILFVCKAAVARQLGELDMKSRTSPLTDDPLPVSFPEAEIRFSFEGDA